MVFTEISRFGVISHNSFDSSFFLSVDYKRIKDLNFQISDLMTTTGVIKRGERNKKVSTFKQAIDWLLNEAKRGRDISRYKGLGEMNPGQLWETTMDPAARTLMKVTIEDAISADEVFTMLMGDHVEPRRDFIEKNALSVENLDV